MQNTLFTQEQRSSLATLLQEAKQNTKTITVYNLAKLVLEYNGQRGTAKQVNKLCKVINKAPDVYITFAKDRGLI